MKKTVKLRPGCGELNKKGISLTEIMVGVALFVLAIIPSFSYLMDSVKQTSATDMENTAGIAASAALDKILDDIEYDKLDKDLKLDEICGMNDEDNTANNELKIKGVVYKFELKVTVIPNDQIQFAFKKTPYIKRQISENEFADAGNDINSLIQNPLWKAPPVKLKLSDITKHKTKTFLKEVLLKVSWKDSKTGRDRFQEFVTMKANLGLVKSEGG